MISTIFNELIVQIVSDFFPKPKAPPGVTMSITVHKPSPSFSFLPFSDFNYRAQNKYKFHRHFVPSFYPSLPSSKHKYKFHRHFVPSFYPSLPSSKHKHKFNRHLLFLPFYPSLPSSKQKQITITIKHRAN